MPATILPTEPRPIRMDPDLAAAIEQLLAPYSGKKLVAAQGAVMGVYHDRSIALQFGELVERYRAAIAKAVA